MSEWLKITYDAEPLRPDELHTVWIKASIVNIIDVEGEHTLTVRLGSGEDWSEIVYKNVHEARLVNTDDDKESCCKETPKQSTDGEGYPYNWRDVIYPDGQPFFCSGSNHYINNNKVSPSSE